jgi:hypothetical protein
MAEKIMSTANRPRSVESHIGRSDSERALRDMSHPEQAIPDDPSEQRRIRNRLIALALVLPILDFLRLLFR